MCTTAGVDLLVTGERGRGDFYRIPSPYGYDIIIFIFLIKQCSVKDLHIIIIIDDNEQ